MTRLDKTTIYKTIPSSYNGSPIVVGSSGGVYKSDFNNRVEILEKNGNWKELEAYPFSSNLGAYSTISMKSSIVTLGGYTSFYRSGITGNCIQCRTDINTVAQFKDGKWTELGSLSKARSGHSSIQFGNSVFVIGGTERKIEIWNQSSILYDGYQAEAEEYDSFFAGASIVVDSTYLSYSDSHKMFDNDDSSFWHSGSKGGGWIQINFHEAQLIETAVTLVITRRDPKGNNNPRYKSVCLLVNKNYNSRTCTDSTGYGDPYLIGNHIYFTIKPIEIKQEFLYFFCHES